MTKRKLIPLIISGAILLTSATGCNEDKKEVLPSNERINFATEISLDINKRILNVVYFDLNIVDGKCVINFLAHNDNGIKDIIHSVDAGSIIIYVGHEDFLVSYEISEEDYKKIMLFYDAPNSEIKYLTLDQLKILSLIVEKQDPINIQTRTDETAKDKIHSIID